MNGSPEAGLPAVGTPEEAPPEPDTLAVGVDIGSTYTKAVVLDRDGRIVGRALRPTGFRLAEAARETIAEAAAQAAAQAAGGARAEASAADGAGAEPRSALPTPPIGYRVATGFGRHQFPEADLQVTDLTAAARGAAHFFPGTRTILDVGGQTMKATRVDDAVKVRSFRLNDKCAAGTGAFLEKTARYMGFETEQIGALIEDSAEPVSISGVCAVFAESEVINHLSQGSRPADIMHGAVISLVGRSVQLMKRVRMEPEFTLVGGILRFERMAQVIRAELGAEVNVPEGDLVQYVSALGAALLARRQMLAGRGAAAGVAA